MGSDIALIIWAGVQAALQLAFVKHLSSHVGVHVPDATPQPAAATQVLGSQEHAPEHNGALATQDCVKPTHAAGQSLVMHT